MVTFSVVAHLNALMALPEDKLQHSAGCILSRGSITCYLKAFKRAAYSPLSDVHWIVLCTPRWFIACVYWDVKRYDSDLCTTWQHAKYKLRESIAENWWNKKNEFSWNIPSIKNFMPTNLCKKLSDHLIALFRLKFFSIYKDERKSINNYTEHNCHQFTSHSVKFVRHNRVSRHRHIRNTECVKMKTYFR
jgi:hypothetical protein